MRMTELRWVALVTLVLMITVVSAEVAITGADPTVLPPGQSMVTVRGRNTGETTALDVEVTLSGTGIEVRSYDGVVGAVGPGETFDIIVSVVPGTETTRSLRAELTWSEADGTANAAPPVLIPFSLRSGEKYIELAGVYPTTTSPGKIIDLIIQLRNRSERDLDHVTVSVARDSGYRVLDGETRTLDSIPAGDRRSLTFETYIHPESIGLVEVPVRITHSKGSEELLVGLIGAPLLRLEVVNLVLPTDALPGELATITFDILNLGDQPVRSARIDTRSAAGEPIPETIYLGIISAQDSRQVTIEVVPNADTANATISVESMLRYRDLFGDEHEERLAHNFQVLAVQAPMPVAPITTGTKPSTGSSTKTFLGPFESAGLLAGVAFLVVAWLAFGYVRKLRDFERELSAERDQLELLEEEEEHEMDSLKRKVEQLETVEYLVSEVERIPIQSIIAHPKRFTDKLVAVGHHVRGVGSRGKHSLVEVSDDTGTVKGVTDGRVRDGPATTMAVVRVEDGTVHLEIKSILRER
ncbi:MAG: hypothetical protein QGG50_00975 [Methanopyri archaeon]|nr:hypothetical protein [Methanopyri archaeon]